MNNDLISREALKNTIIEICGKCSNIITKYENGVPDGNCAIQHILNIIDNAPSVDTTCPHCDSGYAQGYSDGYLRGKEERPQGEITNEDIQQAIKEGFANGYEMAKEKIIHSIAKQYSEHNELVPIWLSIGDIKDGAV